MSSAITSFTCLNLVTHDKSHCLVRSKRFVSWISAAKHGCCSSSRQYVYSFGIHRHRKAKYIMRMDLNAINNLPPLPPPPPPPPSGFRLPGWLIWILLTVIPILISIFTGNWGPLIEIKRRMDITLQQVQNMAETIEDVAEGIDKVADEVSEKLPEGSKLRKMIERIDDIAEETIRAADRAEDLLQKVEDASEKVEKILEEAAKERKVKVEVGMVNKKVSSVKVIEKK